MCISSIYPVDQSFQVDQIYSQAMWCCKYPREDQKSSCEDSDEEAEEKQTVVGELDIKEWTMTLRENVICLDEQNVKVKRLKIEAIEQIETERRLAREKEIDERERELLFQQRILDSARMELEQGRTREQEILIREQELKLQRQALDDRETDLDQRNAVLEIVVRLNEKEQKIALPLKNLLAVQSDQEASDRMFARETELEEKEEELFLRQREIEEREFEMDDKNAVLEIAIRVNDFR